MNTKQEPKFQPGQTVWLKPLQECENKNPRILGRMKPLFGTRQNIKRSYAATGFYELVASCDDYALWCLWHEDWLETEEEHAVRVAGDTPPTELRLEVGKSYRSEKGTIVHIFSSNGNFLGVDGVWRQDGSVRYCGGNTERDFGALVEEVTVDVDLAKAGADESKIVLDPEYEINRLRKDLSDAVKQLQEARTEATRARESESRMGKQWAVAEREREEAREDRRRIDQHAQLLHDQLQEQAGTLFTADQVVALTQRYLAARDD